MSSIMGIVPLINIVVVVVICVLIVSKNGKDLRKETYLKKRIIGPVIGLIVFIGMIFASGWFITLANNEIESIIVALLIVASIDMVIIFIVMIVSVSNYNRKIDAIWRERMALQAGGMYYPPYPPPNYPQ